MTEREVNISVATGASAEGQRAVEAWCHGCEKYGAAFYNPALELECETCRSTFVEKRGQTGLAEYITSVPVDAEESEVAGTEGASNSRAVSVAHERPWSSSGSAEQESEGGAPTTTTSTAHSSSADGGERGSEIPALVQPSASPGAATRFSEEESAIIRRILDSSESPPAGSNRRDGLNGATNIMRTNLRQRAAVPSPDGFNADAIILSLLSALNGVGDLQPGVQLGGNSGIPQDALTDILHHILVNETSVPGAPPASDDDISSIKKIEVTDENIHDLGGACYISQEPFEVGSTVLQLSCGHAFNQNDITKWLKMHNTCPVCREPVSKENDKGDQKEDAAGGAAPPVEGERVEQEDSQLIPPPPPPAAPQIG